MTPSNPATGGSLPEGDHRVLRRQRFINLIDFLADAMHWCDAKGEDFHTDLDPCLPATTRTNSTTNNKTKGD